ncbi:SDR family oxidoreductase [Paraburkholderia panacisoli]|uniref:SDR family oxidoreductase n=1 Tax=Paraburkholderia panacisoli TaxID=2603818 RepID=A0A5B0GY73_9BURK|nr:SDR family oxidoreductase [Paraburkholderia panacisoli]KAA1007804.1 SDR family oxidoreductase [Paraburkholderia panacisoli]
MGTSLQGKVAVVTGGSTGIGLEAAKLFVDEGAFVFITGRRQSELDRAMSEIGHHVRAVQGDISNAADRRRLYEIVAAEAGCIDVLFANAGVGDVGPIGTITEAHFDHIVGVNFKGTLFTVQEALPLFRDGGSIILTGSIAGAKGFGDLVVYSATKAALRSLARTCTAGLKDRKIRVNLLSPGTTDTPIIAPMSDDMKAGFASLAPAGRLAHAAEIATVALFLASDASSFVTGTEIFADGGAAQV